jgi:hypothetical protein
VASGHIFRASSFPSPRGGGVTYPGGAGGEPGPAWLRRCALCLFPPFPHSGRGGPAQNRKGFSLAVCPFCWHFCAFCGFPWASDLSPLWSASASGALGNRYNLGVSALSVHADQPAAGEKARGSQGFLSLRKVRTPQGRPLGETREGAIPGKCHRE